MVGGVPGVKGDAIIPSLTHGRNALRFPGDAPTSPVLNTKGLDQRQLTLIQALGTVATTRICFTTSRRQR